MQTASIPVTADNFTRAETDMYFASVIKAAGGLARLDHHRQPMPIDNQAVIRANRDTLYSSTVCDLDAGPVTITMPEAGQRFISLMVMDEDEYIHDVQYGAGSHTYDRAGIGTRYVMLAARILVDPADPDDIRQVQSLQDQIRLEQKASGAFDIPNWDKDSQGKVRSALLDLGRSLPDTKDMFGTREEVDPVRHLIGAAMAWGGNPEKDALYLNVTPRLNDGKTPYRLHVPAGVPVKGFWSVSVYNADGYFEPNAQNAYSLNNLTAAKNADGSVDVQFGGAGDKATNHLPIVRGWNYLVRLYRPGAEVLSGAYAFPEAQPVH